MEEKKEPNKESKEDIKKAEKLKKEEIKRQKEAKKREEKAKKEEQKRLKKEQKAKEKELRKSLNKSLKSSNKSGHIKLNSSVQFLPSNINNFDFITNELPESFYEDVLIKEMELSEEFSIEKLSSLIKLYSQAMEYYLQNDPPKAKDYQGRMEFLLTNKDTLKKLKKQSDNLTANNTLNISNRNTENQDLKSVKLNKSVNLSKANMKKMVEYKTDSLEFDDISDKVSEVIGDNNIKGDIQTAKNLIEKDLEKQNISWKEKLKHKKKGMLRGSMTFLSNNRGSNFNLKNKVVNMKSSTDEKLNLGGKKLEKMKFIFNDDIYEEVKEENEGEGSDKEKEEKSDKKEQIIDNLEDVEEINIINHNDEEDKKEVEKKEEEKKEEKKEDQKEEKKEEKKEDQKEEKKEEKQEEKQESSDIKIEKRPRRKSIVDKDVTRNVDIDEKILTSVNQKMDLLLKLIDDIENNKLNEEEDDENIENIENNNIIKEDNNNKIIINEKKENILSEIQTDVINVPVKFQSTYYQLESIMQSYMDEFNNFYYKDIFEQFASNLKEIYDNKYKKYIEISVEYHNQIKENEHILENNDNLSEEKKAEIQQIIDSLKDEQQNQIAKIEDEFNRLIVSQVNEFKINSFKNNSGIQLMEEQLKLDIYSLINESFY